MNSQIFKRLYLPFGGKLYVLYTNLKLKCVGVKSTKFVKRCTPVDKFDVYWAVLQAKQ